MKDNEPEKNGKTQDLTIVIPVYNEADSLASFLPNIIEACEINNWKLIIVNDGSTDGSAQLLANAKHNRLLNILHHKVNKGYGGALKTGLSAVETEYTLTMDGDGQHKVHDVNAIYQFAIDNNADMVIGSRKSTGQGSLYRELGKWLIRKFTSILVPLPIKDLNSGFKLYQSKLVQRYLTLCPDSMAFSDVITLLFLYQRHLVMEYPISTKKRTAGRSYISTHTAFQTLIEILSLVMLVNPLRIFLPVSLLSIFVGLLWGIPIILLGRGISVGSMLAIVLGALFFFLGLLANQLSLIRLHLAGLSNKQDTD